MFDAVQLLESQDARADGQRRASTAREIQKSRAAQSQTKIYSTLVECRILLQRAVSSSLVVENDVDDNNVDNRSGRSETKRRKTVQLCNELLSKLFEARSKLGTATSHSENKIESSSSKKKKKDSIFYQNIVNSKDDGKLHECLESEYQQYRDEWKTVLNRRHKDVRLHAGMTTGGGSSSKQFLKVLDSSFWQQVESTVQHEELRLSQTSNDNEDDEDNNSKRLAPFDDTKVYQHMLKDFVVAHQPGQEQTAQMRLRGSSSSKKKKAVVDRRASKGRKIRYTEIAKLSHFTFPTSRPVTYDILDEDEWFRSLFGGAGTISKE